MMNNFRLITNKSSRIVDFKFQAHPRLKWQLQCRQNRSLKFVLTNIHLSHGQHTVINAKEEGKNHKTKNIFIFHFCFSLFPPTTALQIFILGVREGERGGKKKEKWNPKLNFRGYISCFDEASLRFMPKECLSSAWNQRQISFHESRVQSSCRR